MKIAYLCISFCMFCTSYSQDISDFLPLDFDKISNEELNDLKYSTMKLLDDYRNDNPTDSDKIDKSKERLDEILDTSYLRSLNETKDSIKKELASLKTGRKLSDLLDNIDSEFDKYETKYRLRLAARSEIGNNDEVVFNSLAPSLSFNLYYVLKENTKNQGFDKGRLIDYSKPFWATLGITINLNSQSNSSSDTANAISKILSYGADLNSYIGGKCGFNFRPLKFKTLFTVNGGFSYVREKNIESKDETAESTTKISPSNFLFFNCNAAVWFFDIIMFGIKCGISTVLGKEFTDDETKKLTEFKGKFYTAIKIPLLNLGLIMSYLWAPIEGMPTKERFQFKVIQSFDFGI